MEKKTHQKKNGGNAFYIVLSLCLIAVGVAAWSAVSAFSDFKTQDSPTPQIEVPTPTPDTETPVTSELPKVEYEKTEVPEEENEPQVKPQTGATAEYFLMPIDGGKILKNFDETALQYSKTMNDMRLHLGIDISAESGAKVKSAGKGKVTEIYDDSNFGYTVVIDHGNSIIAKYCGMATDLAVAVGDTVDAGTEIGNVGTVRCESLDDTHLHFEMYKDGKAVSPLKTMGME